MVTEYPGNAIPAPTYEVGNHTEDDELLYSAVGYSQKGMTVKAGQGVLLLGTPMAFETTTSRWVAAQSAGANGTGTVRGLLRRSMDTGAAGETKEYQNNILFKGSAKRSKVVAAIQALTDAGDITPVALADVKTALSARDDDLLDYFDF